MKYASYRINYYIIYTLYAYNVMLVLRRHAFTTMPYFLLLCQPICYLHLTYLLRLQAQGSQPNHKSHPRKNLNICPFYLRNNLNVIKGKGGDIVWSMSPLRSMPQKILKQIRSAKG